MLAQKQIVKMEPDYMDEKTGFVPSGISRQQFSSLVEYSHLAEGFDAQQLHRKVQRHLEDAKLVHSRNRIVNFKLASAIAEVLTQVLSQWNDHPSHLRHWIGGAALYFADSRDNEHDFSSAIGFEDDAEVLNACLHCVGLESLRIHIEDFDHA
jgi:uncharacterized membrane protein YkvA (DUF1232 family)